MKPIPVLLITGCLGAGKTTFLNHLLDLPSIRRHKLALIVNEFGPASVDGRLVKAGNYPRFDLNRGSIFCICIKTDFIKTLTEIADRVQPELVLVESTGVADPCDLENFLDEPTLAGKFEVLASVCLVDALNFVRVAAYMKTAENQVRHADGLLLNKMDQVEPADADRLSALLSEINAGAPQERVSFGRMSDAFVWALQHTRKAGQISPCRPSNLNAVSVDLSGIVDKEWLRKALTGMGDRLLRAKGILDFGGGPIVFEVVFGRFHERPAPADAGAARTFTVITSGMPGDKVKARLKRGNC